ncbi:hypothetical protein [Enhygromyxa salina]|uniref:Uncharacterized protein n=1 Tax=Enhygromyxa salina TaxID=215803 RepID=A0A2S9YYQ0_9BACT|nr:hypothetical protein [Enhygromyxa salina]PRQ10204.1 hypothetical protein ENSA7_00120 [Enhygromyxa salina]
MWARRIRLGGVEYEFGDRRTSAPRGARKLTPLELRRLLALHRGDPAFRGLERELASHRPEHVRHRDVRRGAGADSFTGVVCHELPTVVPRVTPGVIERYEPPQVMPSQLQPMFDEQPHWVEILLVGEDDSGIVGIMCEVTLATGKVVRRRTDRHGIVRIEGITSAANCTVTFPNFDEGAWAPG